MVRTPQYPAVPRPGAFRFCALALALATGGAGAPPSMESGTEVANAGFYQLRWEDADAGPDTRFELQESRGGRFTDPETVYRGPDLALSMSGRGDGDYSYRVRALPAEGAPSAWSEPVTVRVEHHPLGRAFTFFTAGAVVFLATLGLIVAGSLRDLRREG